MKRWLARLKKPPKKREISPDDIPTPIPRFIVRTTRGADHEALAPAPTDSSASAVDTEVAPEAPPPPVATPAAPPGQLQMKESAFSACVAYAFGSSRRIIIAAGAFLGIVLVILGGIAYKTGVVGFPLWAKSHEEETRSLPPSGTIYIYSAIKPVAPFTIHGHTTMPSMLTLRHKHSRARAMSVFIHAGSTVETKAPLGDYLVQCGYGMSWYGENRAFGASGTYIQGKSYLEFWVDKQHRRLWGNTFDIGATVEESSQDNYVKIPQEDFTL